MMGQKLDVKISTDVMAIFGTFIFQIFLNSKLQNSFNMKKTKFRFPKSVLTIVVKLCSKNPHKT